MPKFLRPLSTIFGRLALLSVALLVLMQLTWLTVVDRDRAYVEADHVSRLVRLVMDPSAGDQHDAAHIAAILGLRYLSLAPQQLPAICSGNCQDSNGPFETALRQRLPPFSLVVFSANHGVVWIRYGTGPHWLVIPTEVPSLSRLISAMALTLLLAITIALLGAWQIQKPVLRLARAAREFRLGHRLPDVKADGPSEVKGLIDDFNNMARELLDAEQERAVMLAGVAHDLRAPLTRIQVRASLVPEGEVRAGFVHDAESLSQIVTQFLDFARDTEVNAAAPWVCVDDFCRNHYADDEAAAQEPIFHLDLQAGDKFRLPAIELDRILSNLAENAFSYGALPLHISTLELHGQYRLIFRDHGPGIAEDQFDRVLRPFVRIDPARGGDAHCGLGLTIVRRLTRRYGGELKLSNAPDGGLVVSLDFPPQQPAA